MSRYVDGFVLPGAKKNLARYRRVARKESVRRAMAIQLIINCGLASGG